MRENETGHLKQEKNKENTDEIKTGETCGKELQECEPTEKETNKQIAFTKNFGEEAVSTVVQDFVIQSTDKGGIETELQEDGEHGHEERDIDDRTVCELGSEHKPSFAVDVGSEKMYPASLVSHCIETALDLSEEADERPGHLIEDPRLTSNWPGVSVRREGESSSVSHRVEDSPGSPVPTYSSLAHRGSLTPGDFPSTMAHGTTQSDLPQNSTSVLSHEAPISRPLRETSSVPAISHQVCRPSDSSYSLLCHQTQLEPPRSPVSSVSHQVTYDSSIPQDTSSLPKQPAEAHNNHLKNADVTEEEQSGDTTKEVQSGDTTEEMQSDDTTQEIQRADVTEVEPSGDTTKEEHSGETTKEEHSGDTSKEEHIGDTTKEEQSGDTTEEMQSGDTTEEMQSDDTTQEIQRGDVTEEELSGDTTKEIQSANATEEEQSGYITQELQSGDTTKEHSGDTTEEIQSGDTNKEIQSGVLAEGSVKTNSLTDVSEGRESHEGETLLTQTEARQSEETCLIQNIEIMPQQRSDGEGTCQDTIGGLDDPPSQTERLGAEERRVVAVLSEDCNDVNNTDRSVADQAQRGSLAEKSEQMSNSRTLNRSTSLTTDPSRPPRKSTSSTSLKSDGDSESVDGSISSLVSSPAPARKPRPKVLRNFNLSAFTGKSPDQKPKYLPAPRIRKSSSEDMNRSKPIAPKRKGRRKSDESPQHSNRSEPQRTFEFKFVGSKSSVQVVGSFNNWIPEDLYDNNNGVWSKHVQLSAGTYSFR